MKKYWEYILAVALAIATFFGGMYKEEITNSLFGGSEYENLEGNWITSWDEDKTKEYPKGRTLPEEHVEITNVNGQLLYGEGISKVYGSYEIKGRISKYTIAARYVQARKDQSKPPGVFVLRIVESTPHILEGYWVQNTERGIVHGTTIWTRVN